MLFKLIACLVLLGASPLVTAQDVGTESQMTVQEINTIKSKLAGAKPAKVTVPISVIVQVGKEIAKIGGGGVGENQELSIWRDDDYILVAFNIVPPKAEKGMPAVDSVSREMLFTAHGRVLSIASP